MSDFEPDPEVLADAHLRNETERDSTRTRGQGVYDWQPSPTVAQWPCRNAKCGALCDVTQDAIDHLAMFNRQLARSGKPAIQPAEVMACKSCRSLLEEWRERGNRRVVTDMAVALKRLRASNNPEGETELIRMLEACRYPDVQAAIRAMRASIEARKAKPGRMGSV